MSRAGELGAYPARRNVHGISFFVRDAQELLFLTLEQFGQYFGYDGRGVRTLPAAAGGVILPIVVPHGKPSVLEWLNPRTMEVAFTSTIDNSDWASVLILLMS